MHTITCSFIGLGLIGGSIARALREYFPNMKIKDFKKALQQQGFDKLSIDKLIRQIKSNGYVWLDIKERQYLCIAND